MAGIAATLMLATTGCDQINEEVYNKPPNSGSSYGGQLMGDVAAPVYPIG